MKKNLVTTATALIVLIEGAFGAPSETRPLQSTTTHRVSCGALAGIALTASAITIPSGPVTITSAALVPPTGAGRTGDGSGAIYEPPAPEFCKVLGTIAPLDPAAPIVNFQVNLPTDWNERAIQLGGGGLSGAVPASLNTHRNAPEAQPVDVGGPITKGYIELGNDGGHSGGYPSRTPNDEWLLNAEAVRNWLRDADKKNLDAAIALAKLYYGQVPSLKYLMGSSGGGRQALEMAQAYPDDYDGIYSQVPSIGFLSLTLRATVFAQQQTTSERWLPPSKVPLIAHEVLRQCDALDGIADGVVSAYEACNARFVNHPVSAKPWARIRCESGRDEGPSCLSDGQITTLDFIHRDVDYGYPIGHGSRVAAGLGVGGEKGGWVTERTMPTSSYSGGLLPQLWKALIVGDLNFQQMLWDPPKYKDNFVRMSNYVDSQNPDLSRFFAHGGKLIIKSNTGDYTVNWREAIAYYNRVVTTVGRDKADAYLRFYVAPGIAHSMMNNPVQRSVTEDELPSQLDSVDLLDGWVRGRATPGDAVMLYQKNPLPPFTVTSSRPMCRYPLVAKFVGGDKANGQNYRC